jgi:putative thioredoxin
VYGKIDIDANPGLANEFDVRGVPSVKAFRNGSVVSEFAGVRSPQAVAEFLDALTRPSEADQLLEELRRSGEWPEVVAALERDDYEGALEFLLGQAADGTPDGREKARRLMVALFERLGVQHPLSLYYRRRLASAIF